MPHLVSHITQVFSVHHKLGMMIYNRHALELAHNFFAHTAGSLFFSIPHSRTRALAARSPHTCIFPF